MTDEMQRMLTRILYWALCVLVVLAILAGMYAWEKIHTLGTTSGPAQTPTAHLTLEQHLIESTTAPSSSLATSSAEEQTLVKGSSASSGGALTPAQQAERQTLINSTTAH
jgi:hypothetical protein